MFTTDFNNHNCFAQSGVKYATGGNILASTDIFGSTNNASVNFVSNGKKWMTLSPNGLFDISGQTRTRSNAAFDSSVTALTLIAQQAQFSTVVVTGQITLGSLIVNGNATINGQLTTGTLDAQTILQNGNPINQSQWTTSATSIFYSNGNVGIGTNNPTEMLTVEGRVRISGLPNPIDTTALPPAQQRSLIFDGGTDEISATSGTLTFPNTNLVTTGSISSSVLNSTSITTQQLTISGGMLESDTMHARKTFSVNNSLKLERQTTNNFAEVSTIDTSVALVLQRDTTGRGVGIGTTPSLGERLSVAGDVGIINGNLRVSNLSGVGDRQLLIDGSGNLKSGNPAPLFGCAGPWCINGNPNTNPSTDFLGTTDAQDLIFKTDASGTGGERMRILANGDVRFIAGVGNVMIKTDFGPGGAAEAKVGIGTENPVRSLHVYTTHYPDNPPPPCPNNDPNCIPSQGSHMGMRLDDLTQIGNQTPVRTIWDIAPYYNPAIASSGSLVIGKGNLTDESIDAKMILLDNGNVGIGTTTPAAPLEVKGSISIYDGNANTSLFFAREQVSNNTFGKWGIQYVPVGTLSAQAKGGLNFWIPAAPGNNFGNNYLFLADDGNVGIGTNNPPYRLTIAENNVDVAALAAGDPAVSRILMYSNLGSNNSNSLVEQGDQGIFFGNNKVVSQQPALVIAPQPVGFSVTSDNGIRIAPDGKVSIGIPQSKMTDINHNGFYRLYVAGGIMTESCRVAFKNNLNEWGDWVFDKNNKRMTFEEQWDYYMKHKHLKWIPSGDEVKKNGFDVAEVVTGVVINLEEARMDAIQLHKENLEQKKAIVELKEEMKKMQKQIEELKKK